MRHYFYFLYHLLNHWLERTLTTLLDNNLDLPFKRTWTWITLAGYEKYLILLQTTLTFGFARTTHNLPQRN